MKTQIEKRQIRRLERNLKEIERVLFEFVESVQFEAGDDTCDWDLGVCEIFLARISERLLLVSDIIKATKAAR